MARKFLALLIVLLAAPLVMSARNYDISLKHADAETSLARLQQVTGYDFVYQSELLKGSDVFITADFKDASLESILDNVITARLGLSWKLVKNTIVLSKPTAVKGAPVAVTGTVRDHEGEPVVGASVKVVGETLGVATNVDGEFSISAPIGSSLSISYIGMNPQVVKVTSDKKINVEMQQSTTMLSEVVITGYQEIKKEKMTGSVATISADKLQERYTPNLLDNLEGRVAGLSTYGGSMVIRGLGTLRASSSPLLVVDGLPIEGSINDINPSDIESINVLKDASASAIYGARAANGIIVITTKNAKKQGKIDVDFSANLTWYENRNMDYHDNFYMNAEEQIAAESAWYEYRFFEKDGIKNDPATQLMYEDLYIQSGYMSPSPVEYAYYQLAKGEIDRNQLNATIDGLRGNNYAQDFADAVYRRQVIQQYNLALRSASDKMRNNIVANYKHDNSGIINHKNDWINISYKGSYDMAKWLTATLSINSVISDKRSFGQDYSGTATNPWAHPAYYPFYNEDGSIKRQYDCQLSGSEYMSFGSAFHDLASDPIEEIHNNTMDTHRQNTRYHADLLFKIIPGLTANTQFIYETETNRSDWHATELSHASRTIRNAYTVSDGNGGYKYLTPENGGILRSSETRTRSWTARGQLNYSRTFGKHDIAAIAGLEFRETLLKGSNSLYLGYDDQLQTSNTISVDLGSLSSMYSNPYYMSLVGGFPSMSQVFYPYISSGLAIIPEQHHRYGSGYFNLTYTYDERYNLFGSFRKDYADVFGLNSKFRGKPLWSVGIGWNIHNEPFIHDVTWLNFLKLRASYGVTGNIYQGATSVMTASTGKNNYYTHFPYATIKSPANPDLRWEQNKTTNVGVDFSLLNYRMRGTVDVYNKEGKDVFNTMNLDPTFGFTSMVANVASIRNRGVEATLSYDWFKPSRQSDFFWSTGVTFTYNKNVVTNVDNDSQMSYQMLSNPYKKGYPVRAMWSYRFAGISNEEGQQGTPVYYIENGNTSTNPMSAGVDVLEFSGQRDPKWIIGLDNTWRWNGISLGIVMSYYGGHKMYAQPYKEFTNSYTLPAPIYLLNSWTPENPTDMPGQGKYAASGFGSTSSYSTQCVIDASFIKIRNISLGYTIPESFTRRFGVNMLSVRFQANDLKAIWVANDRGIDPETGGLRNPSSYTVGINLNL